MNQEEEVQTGPSATKLLLKATAISVVFVSFFIFITIIVASIFAYSKLSTFSTAAEYSFEELYSLFQNGWSKQVVQSNNKKNILVLGVDSLENRGDVPPLTDSILIASLDINSGTITTIPLPRDIWHEGYKTKINALLAYGQERNPEKPTLFPEETLSELLNVEFHHTVVLSLDDLADAVDVLGGIEVDVKESFTDTEFPRSDVDITTETDPEKLYQTISFAKGVEKMDGQRVLQFIRSRKSEGDQGTDIARSERQQLVIISIIDTLKQKQTIIDMQKMGSLLAFYSKTFGTQISLEEVIALGKVLFPHRNDITFTSASLPVYPEDDAGAIWNPPVWKYQGLWVYEIQDLDLLQTQVKEALN